MGTTSDQDILIYQAEDGTAVLDVRLQGETLWLSQEQMASLFDVQKAAVSKHLKNIYASGELDRPATVSKMETVQQEGRRSVVRQIEHFNLDAVISVGYRVNSTRATRFRQWATRTLREHLTQGYTLNRQRLEANTREQGLTRRRGGAETRTLHSKTRLSSVSPRLRVTRNPGNNPCTSTT